MWLVATLLDWALEDRGCYNSVPGLQDHILLAFLQQKKQKPQRFLCVCVCSSLLPPSHQNTPLNSWDSPSLLVSASFLFYSYPLFFSSVFLPSWFPHIMLFVLILFSTWKNTSSCLICITYTNVIISVERSWMLLKPVTIFMDFNENPP